MTIRGGCKVHGLLWGPSVCQHYRAITITAVSAGHQDLKGVLHDLHDDMKRHVFWLHGTLPWDLIARPLTAIYQWHKEVLELDSCTEIRKIEDQKT